MTSREKLIEEIMASFHALRNKMHARMSHPANKGRITYSQLFVLVIIEQHHKIGIKEISAKLNISSSAATQLVNGLVANGYVTRRADAQDRRALQLELSAKGHRYIVNQKNKRMKIFAELFSALSDRELTTYLALHQKLLPKISVKIL